MNFDIFTKKGLIYDLCMGYTREIVKKHPKLDSISIAKTALALALKEIDFLNKNKIQDKEYYYLNAEDYSNFLEIHNMVQFYLQIRESKTFDIKLDREEKLKIYKNSIKRAEELFQKMVVQDNYRDNKKLKLRHDEIIENCHDKYDDDIDIVFSLLKKTSTNFIIKYDDFSYYPIITDLLYDTLSLEYSFELHKGYYDLITPQINLIRIKADVLGATTYKIYRKVSFIKEIGRKKINLYLLHEYVRQFNCDLDSMRELYKHILYMDVKSHPTALNSTKFNIKDVKPLIFILTQSKYINDFG